MLRPRSDGPARGTWLTVPDPVVAEAALSAAPDFAVVDLQHGTLTAAAVPPLLIAGRAAGIETWVRVPANDPAIIGWVLDVGAAGVIVPLVESVAETVAAVAACRYPPAGRRSFGPFRASLVGVTDPGCIVMIETAAAVDAVDAIAAVPGLTGLYVGPVDLGISLGLPPNVDHADSRFTDALAAVVAAAKANGLVVGAHAAPGLVATRGAQGFEFLTVTSDLGGVVAGVRSAMGR
jgi:4-hydroxy-2-oxoheptanedioate aldolase